MNLGLNDKLNSLFPETKAVVISKVHNTINPHWLLGFAEGEGCLFISIYKSPASKLKQAVQLVFKITQHSRDIELMKRICGFLCCGRIENRNNNGCDFTVISFKDIEAKVVPFFLEYKLMGFKYNNFNHFNKAVKIIKDKEHLTEQGMEKIKYIKIQMNIRKT